jgi:hypothetical protein
LLRLVDTSLACKFVGPASDFACWAPRQHGDAKLARTRKRAAGSVQSAKVGPTGLFVDRKMQTLSRGEDLLGARLRTVFAETSELHGLRCDVNHSALSALCATQFATPCGVR